MEKDRNPFRILVIEDNPGDFTLIEDFLEEQIFSPVIFQAKNFREGKNLLRNEKLGVNVILLDLSLPDKSGEELIVEMLPISCGIPIIILTGYPDVAFSVKSLSLGVSDYLLKDDLSATVLYKSILYSIERKKKSIELEESERRYSDLFQLSPQPMWVYDVDSLRFVNVNSSAIKHYGYSYEEFLSMTIEDIGPAEDLFLLKEALHISMQTKQTYNNGIFRHLKKNGEIILVEVQSNTIQVHGRDTRVVLINDITERLNYIQAIEKQNEKLQEIAWMQSHVFRAPVARLMSLIDLVQNYPNDAVEQKDLLERMLTSARELDEIIRKIAGKSQEV